MNLIQKEWVKEFLDTTWRSSNSPKELTKRVSEWLAVTFEYFEKDVAFEEARDANRKYIFRKGE